MASRALRIVRIVLHVFVCVLILKISIYVSDPNERAHFWLPGSEAKTSHELLDSPTDDRMYIDAGEIVRVRVEADEFYDDEPGPPKATEGVQQLHLENRRAPYTITVRAMT